MLCKGLLLMFSWVVLLFGLLNTVYLGIPVGWSMLETHHLLQKWISVVYSHVVVYKCQFDWWILAHLYNAMALPHYLYLSPFWKTFQKEDKKELQSTYCKYAKYLLQLPPWISNCMTS